MTIKPLKPCKHAGCRAYAEKEGYCLKHYKERFSYYFQDKRISPSKLGYNRKWDRARKEYLRNHPLCVILRKTCHRSRSYHSAQRFCCFIFGSQEIGRRFVIPVTARKQ
jgi:hypothetical protein